LRSVKEGLSMFHAAITFCTTRDLGRLARFYEEVMGLPLALDQGGCRIYRVAGSGYFAFCEREEAGATDGVLLTFVTDDVDGWHERLLGAGTPIDSPPKENAEYGIYHFFAKDPDGNRLEFQRFLDPAWDGS
jgi:predicted enzyme related to lactoylglutathione lyase